MKYFWAFLGLLFSASLHAGPVLNLQSASDLGNLQIGENVTLQVHLSGLGVDDALEVLAADVTFNGSLFSSPIISMGGIIPDPSGFADASGSGLASGSFDSLFTASGTDAITSEGIFFEFEVRAQQTGSGTFAINFADSIGSDASGASLPVAIVGTHAVLPFQIIPEPASVTLLFAAAGALFIRRQH